jgi:hypothetical protein
MIKNSGDNRKGMKKENLAIMESPRIYIANSCPKENAEE